MLLAIALAPGRRRSVQPGSGRQEPAAQLRDSAVDRGASLTMVGFFVWEKKATTRLLEPAGVKFRPFLAALGAIADRRRRTDGDPGQRRIVRSGRARHGQERSRSGCCCASSSRCRSARCSAAGWPPGIGDRPIAVVGLLIAAIRLLADLALGCQRALRPPRFRAVHTAGLRHRPGAGRFRTGSGDRPADLCGAAGGPARRARDRVGRCGGLPDDRHAHRYGGLVGVGVCTGSTRSCSRCPSSTPAICWTPDDS